MAKPKKPKIVLVKPISNVHRKLKTRISIGTERKIHPTFFLKCKYYWRVLRLRGVLPEAEKHVLFEFMERDLVVLEKIKESERTAEITSEINHLNIALKSLGLELGKEPKSESNVLGSESKKKVA